MKVSKIADGVWLADHQIGGRNGPRIRKRFATREEARQWLEFSVGQVQSGKPWKPKRDIRTLKTVFQSWHDLHGVHLDDGARRLVLLTNFAERLKDPIASTFNAGMFMRERNRMIESGSALNTVNNLLAYTKATFSTLSKVGEWQSDNPLKNVSKIKVDQEMIEFLSVTEINKLLGQTKVADNPHVHLITKICLATGARWGEAEGLRADQVRDGKVYFEKTKTSKARTVPLDEDVEFEIYRLNKRGKVRLFESSYGAFRVALTKAGLKKKKGQLSHLLRHTFASHFMANGGSITTLRDILGHHSLSQTTKYAHSAPEHLEQAKTLNPLTAARFIDDQMTTQGGTSQH